MTVGELRHKLIGIPPGTLVEGLRSIFVTLGHGGKPGDCGQPATQPKPPQIVINPKLKRLRNPE